MKNWKPTNHKIRPTKIFLETDMIDFTREHIQTLIFFNTFLVLIPI